MIYGYIRVSTDRQTTENQRFEIQNFAAGNGIVIDKWIEETISGASDLEKRRLGRLIRRARPGDLIIASELSRLGRNLMQVFSILNRLMNTGAKVWTIKDNYRLGDDIPSKVLAFAFGLSAEIERNMISQRTKEALARLRAEGRILGRPRGSKGMRLKLTGREGDIEKMLARGFCKAKIARKLRVHRTTLSSFVKCGNL
jgi:DNA invertase Pin-like site-specific DNA recombinase